MSKLLWVALPLLALALYVTVQSWRRRPPSRPALNAASSLLLAAYVITTAGLGIFWVANQQLPVFDWHYLFGYATLLLVLLHLAFNLGTAWRQLKPGTPAPPAAAAGRRRVALGFTGLLALAGAYWLGLRHGRSELRLATPGTEGPADPATRALAAVERYQAHSGHTRGGLLRRAAGSDWQDPPPRFKRDPSLARVALPPARPTGAAGPSLQTVATLLWHVAGVSAWRGPLPLRCSPSSGALFSTELYLVARTVEGLPPGLWHYDARDHALERLAELPPPAAALGAGDAAAWDALPAALIATAVFGRTGHKYRDRAYRYVLADLGHALENLQLAATALGLQAPLAPRFDEARAAATLALDERVEGVLALAALLPTGADPGALAALQVPPASSPGLAATLDDATPQALTAAMHRLSSWSAAVAPLALAPVSAATPTLPIALPAPRVQPGSTPADALATIAARRSRRRHAERPLPLALLAELLARLELTRPRLSPALRADLLVHAAEGLAPGAYRYEPRHHLLLPRPGSTRGRAASRAAALEQDVIGEAAAVLLLSMDRTAFAADPGGPARGWRHAYLEAGLAGERAYLAGEALGLAVCGVGAFYDEELAALAGLDAAREWPLHLVALGWPA